VKAAVPIVKMSGAGNDFIVLGAQEASLLGSSLVAWTRRVCRRGLSVGADGVLVVTPSSANRVRVRFLNPDGSEAFCGNGSRCAARFAERRGLAHSPLVLETAIGDVPATVHADGSVRVVVPRPRERGEVRIDLDGTPVEGRLVSAGNPHLVWFVRDLARQPLSIYGPRLRAHERFAPEGVNVNLVSWLDHDAIAIRTWERGVEGETLACGSGALAAAHVASELRALRRVRVVPASGVPLVIEIPAPQDPETASLTGDARIVFEGIVSAEGIGEIETQG